MIPSTPSKKRLTPRQFAVFKFIRERVDTTGFPPTRKEIADRFGFSSPNAAEGHLRALERKGLIALHPKEARGIQLKAGAETPRTLGPGVRIQFSSDRLRTSFVEADEFVRVPDNSLAPNGINKGDLLGIRHRTSLPAEPKLLLLEMEGRRFLGFPENGTGGLPPGASLVGEAAFLIREAVQEKPSE